ncbi:MAG: hypothetical protein IT168_28925 [Bryobacterales bacterium]|nr:hypothetical protein [Bryobacterales bacterium]
MIWPRVACEGDKFLFVADNNNIPGGPRKLWRFDLNARGQVNLGSKKLIFDWENGRGPDGRKMDREGRHYAAAGPNKDNRFETSSKYKEGSICSIKPVS